MSSVDTSFAVWMYGRVKDCKKTCMLVNTGSAVTIVKHLIWKESTGGMDALIQSATRPIVVPNGGELPVCRKTDVILQVGGIKECCAVYVAPGITTDNLLGTDFLNRFVYVVNLGNETLLAGAKDVPLHSSLQSLHSSCLVFFAETMSTTETSSCSACAIGCK